MALVNRRDPSNKMRYQLPPKKTKVALQSLFGSIRLTNTPTYRVEMYS